MNARPQRTDKTQPRPYWPIVTTEALADDVRASRVMAAMGFTMRLGSSRRGDIVWWPTTYLRYRPWRVRIGESNTIAGQGFRAGEWTAEAIERADAIDAIDRERIAEINRGIRDCLVLFMARPKQTRPGMPREYDCYAIDTSTGEWIGTAHLASQRGDDLISLGMVIWQCGFPQAAGRIARAAGFEIPRITYG